MTPLISAIAGRHNAALLAALHRENFARPWNAESFAELLADRGAVASLATIDAQPVGFILCRAALDEAELLTLAVHEAWRGQGIGATLLEAGMAQVRARGAARMYLEVAVDNASALALYAKTGFRQVGVRPAYYANPGGAAIDALLLRRDIAFS